ncbi:hypothetical protein U27_03065 [Candidatus Vecturithrix granuli]|uniref:Uncharacterized protein n=1 Tax=Vecturithrix granuli TaxID=1499967 RepID=A0A081BUU8_VECG1|nr:hypothetical protein U27_03065 [Candidatus Vecturithrix granuli]
MKKMIVSLFLGGLAAGFFFSGLIVRAEVIDKIAAILNDEVILLSELHEVMENPAVNVLVHLDSANSKIQDVLQYVIERQLLAREIQYLATPKDLETVKSLAIQYIVNTYYQQQRQPFDQQLATSGISEAQLNDELLLYMKGVDYIRRKYRFNANIDDQDVVMNLFQQWVKELKTKAQVQILE